MFNGSIDYLPTTKFNGDAIGDRSSAFRLRLFTFVDDDDVKVTGV